MKTSLIINRLFFFILVFPSALFAQDITGLWKGEIYVDSLKIHLPYEILISEDKGKLTGYSRVVFFKEGKQDGVEEPGIQDISIVQKDDKVIIKDDGFLEHRFSIKPPKEVKKTMLLNLVVSDTDMVLTGTWSTNKTRYYLVATGTATLMRKIEYKVSALYKRLDSLKLTSKLVINPPVKKELPIIAITTVPILKPVIEKTPEPDPELIIPAIAKSTFTLQTLNKKAQVSKAKVSPPSQQKRVIYNAISITKLIYIPKEVVPELQPAITVESKPKTDPIVAPGSIIASKPAVVAPVVAAPKPAPILTKTITEPKPIAAVPVPAVSKPASVVAKPVTASKPAVSTPVVAAPKSEIVVPKPVAASKPPVTPPVITVAKPTPVTVKAIAESKPVIAATKPATTLQMPVEKPLPASIVIAPSVTQGAAEIEKRTTKSDQLFYFEKDSLVLTLYDNGEVDGDTVTVLMNGGIIFSKQGLNTTANTKTIYIPANTDSVNLVMYAESLGEIPPNTGLMIIMDGDNRYEVRFSADLKSNAGIILRRRKKE